jgi:hypothetical protein
VLVVGVFSLLLYIFRSKYPGYPYRFLLWGYWTVADYLSSNHWLSLVDLKFTWECDAWLTWCVE